ncbi:MAG: glycosyltransferase [Patescibacteria group bacterium]|nr:glycosyltransferase [Patescibacteria group bacterium]
MKIFIIFSFKQGPYGGGNQFLKALRKEFKKNNAYAERPEQADVFLFNSFQDAEKVIKLKRRFIDKPFVHRVDGPIALYRNSKNTFPDKLIFELNKKIAQATIFQSFFSLRENKRLGLKLDNPYKIIKNAAQKDIFYPAADRDFDFSKRKARLISTSWSDNMMKGFEVYQYLDKHLDFSKYDYVFVGRTPVEFKNIKMLSPRSSRELAALMRESDIYITASRKDPCSNSLIEALSSGLPAVALNDGGHPEIIGGGGELFLKKQEIQGKLELIVNNHSKYVKKIPAFDISRVSVEYLEFIKKTAERGAGGEKIKKISLRDELGLRLKLMLNRK